MSTQFVYGAAKGVSGKIYTFSGTATDDTEFTLQSNTSTSGVNQTGALNIGQLAEGDSITHFAITASGHTPLYAYLEDPNGRVFMPIASLGKSAALQTGIMKPLPAPVKMVNGFTIKVLTTDVSSGKEKVGVALYGPGPMAKDVFTATIQNGTAASFISVKTGLPVGQALSSQVVTGAMVSGGASDNMGASLSFPFVIMQSSSGSSKGAFALQNGDVETVEMQDIGRIMVDQNDQMEIFGKQ